MGEFDSILVRAEVGGNRKLRRFTPEQRWCVVAGVWCLAAKSPVRGYLMISDKLPVEEKDIAEQAGVSLKVVRATLKKMRALDMLETDGCLDPTGIVAGFAKAPSVAWRRRYQREQEADGQATDAQLAARVEFYGGLCWICRAAPFDAIDHVKPLAAGGSNWPANRRPACTPCNSRKGSKWPFETGV